MLKLLKEKSFNYLYSNSRCCSVSVKDDALILEPHIFLGKKEGLVVDNNRAQEFNFSLDNKLEITSLILKSLEHSQFV